MQQNRTIAVLIGVILIMSLMVLALGALSAFLLFQQPANTAMQLQPTTTPAAPAVTVVAPASIEPTFTPAASSQPVCGATGTMSVLFTGADNTTGVWPFGADSVRVVKVDYDRSKITVVAFPRDLWVKTAGLAGQNRPENALGLAYHYKREASRGTDKARTTAATTQVGQALYDTFGLAPQSYITLQLDSFPGMVNALGGVEIENPVAFTSEYGTKFPTGRQTLTGFQASEYVRSAVQGDAARIQRQNIFVRAVQRRILSLGMLAQAPDLINEFSQAFTTDLSPNQLVSLACMLSQVPPDQVNYYEIGGDLVTQGEGRILLPNVERIKIKLSEWLDE